MIHGLLTALQTEQNNQKMNKTILQALKKHISKKGRYSHRDEWINLLKSLFEFPQ